MNETLLRILTLLVFPIISFLISLSLTALCIRILPRLGFVDRGGGRHIHQGSIPRGGGIAIVAAVFFTILAHGVSGNNSGSFNLLRSSMLPAGIILVTGILDDRFGLRSRVKLLLQIAAALLIWWGYHKELTICGWVLPEYLSLGITVLWVVGVINAFNMIDGLDGLATGLAVISGACLSFWFFSRNDPKALYMLIFVGACLGFLRWNFSPAKIFLGDTGSMFLGLFLAVAGGGTLDYTATLTSLLLPPLIIGLPIFDMVLAVWRRSVRKGLNPDAAGLMDADSDHLHHRLFRRNHSHSRSALTMYVFGGIFAGLALLLLFFRDRASAVAFLLILLTLLVMLRRLAVVELFDSMAFLRQIRFRRHLFISALHPLFDLIVIGVSAGIFDYSIRGIVEIRFVVCAGLSVMLMLVFGSTYRVFWLRASMGDRGRLFFFSLLGGWMAVMALYWLHFNGEPPENFFRGAVLFILMVSMLLLLERFILHYVESAWYHIFMMEYRHPDTARVLFAGGGDRVRMCMMCYGCSRRRIRMDNIVGIVDDDPKLFGRRSWDLPIVGGVDDLEAIYRRTKFDKVLITTRKFAPEALEKIRRFCAEKGLACTQFVTEGAGLSADVPVKTRMRRFAERFPWPLADAVFIGILTGIVAKAAPYRLLYILLSTLLPLVAMSVSGVYRINWMRAGIGGRWRLLKWSSVGGLLAQCGFALWLIFFRHEPPSVSWLIGAAVYLLGLTGGLQFIRLLLHPTVFYAFRLPRRERGEKVMLFGGGLLCRLYLQLLQSDASPVHPEICGIIDDDDVLHGMRCNGVRVVGGSGDLEAVYRRCRFDRILLTTDVISGPSLTRLHEFCAASGVKFSAFSVREAVLPPR